MDEELRLEKLLNETLRKDLETSEERLKREIERSRIDDVSRLNPTTFSTPLRRRRRSESSSISCSSPDMVSLD